MAQSSTMVVARWLLVAGWLFASVATQAASAVQWPERTFTEHRPSGSVFSVAQTTDGYLWFGTNTGLFRWDGFKYARFGPNNTPALSHARIHHLQATPDGRLWIASGFPGASQGAWERGGPGLVLYEKGHFSRLGAAQGLPDEWVTSLARDHLGHLWVGTRGGLASWQNNRIVNHGAAPGSEGGVHHVRCDGERRAWIGTSLGLVRFERGDFTMAMPGIHPIASTRAPDGTLYITNLHKIYRLPPKALDWQEVTTFPTPGNIRALHADAEGGLWVGGSGLLRFDKHGRQQHSALNGHTVQALFADGEGSLWAGTREAGVFQGVL